MHFNLPVQTDWVLPDPKQYSAVEFEGFIYTQLSLQLYFDVSFISLNLYFTPSTSSSEQQLPKF